MKKLFEPECGILTVKYLPDGGVSSENPPRFSWIPSNTENRWYVLNISKEKNFSEDSTLVYKDLPYNFFVPDKYLDNGDYYWRYGLVTENGIAYSRVREFSIDDTSVKSCIKYYKNRFEDVDLSHPRLWMNNDKIIKFRESLKKNPSYCNFDRFMNSCVKPRLGKQIVSEPARYPDDKRVVHLWRQNYMDCQEAYNHIKFLTVAGVILEDKDIISQAVKALLSVASWDVVGSTGRDYNDECAFRVEEALSWGYDWLYNYMSEQERTIVRKVLFIRTKQVADHAMISSKIHFSLFDSHAIRSLSSAMVPACVAMLGECSEVEYWLNYTVDYLSVLYTPWGGTDGGWAEGGLYWTTGMAYLISALDILKNYTGIDIFKRPFFQQTGSYPLYCFPHDTYRASFCDQSNLGEKPILKTAFNAREFAGITGNGEYQWYFEQIKKRESYDDTRFFNIGWWDFYFDEMVYLSNYGEVKPTSPKSGRNYKWFKDIGWVAIHKDMDNEENHISFITKSSPYGSVSHSHGDQNSILLFAFGEPLLIESGYYIGFNTSMHRDWRKKTISQNTLLINGQSQYFGMDKTQQLSSTGKILKVEETKNCLYVSEDATNAYKITVPEIKNYTRDIYFVDDTYFILVDSVELESEGYVDFQLHSVFKPEYKDDLYHIKGEKAELSCEIIYVSSGTDKVEILNSFDGVNKEEIKGLPVSYRFKLTTKKSKKHVIVSCIHPKKIDDCNNINVIKDDQGHDVYFYFNNDGKTYTVFVDGNKRY